MTGAANRPDRKECRLAGSSEFLLLERCNVRGNGGYLVVTQERHDQAHQLSLAAALAVFPCVELRFDVLLVLAGDAWKIRLDAASRRAVT